MPFDLPAERVLPLLESRERAGAMDARPAWDWLTASGDVPEVTLRGLEYFLWYQLPATMLAGSRRRRASLGPRRPSTWWPRCSSYSSSSRGLLRTHDFVRQNSVDYAVLTEDGDLPVFHATRMGAQYRRPYEEALRCRY